MKQNNIMAPNYDQELARLVQSLYPNDYVHTSSLPKAHRGSGPIRAIVIGADPTWLHREQDFQTVFGIDPQNGSPFFNSILENLERIGLSLDTIYVQNLVKSYFDKETSQNKIWPHCALLWLENLKRELDEKFDRTIPMFVTAKPIMKAVVFQEFLKGIKNPQIYEQNIIFPPEQNFFNRKVIVLFRHFKYQLGKWPVYSDFLKKQLQQ